MNIVFLTTQSSTQSTLIGRVVPLAEECMRMGHGVKVFMHAEQKHKSGSSVFPGTAIPIQYTGISPFTRFAEGKKRAKGIFLIMRMGANAIRAALGLFLERPDTIVIVKPLPENTLAVLLAKVFLWNTKIVLDVDDFELSANSLSSRAQRAAVHASERIAAMIASSIAVATPFLLDHMGQLTAGKKPIILIPTGLNTITAIPGNNHVMMYMGSVSISSGHKVDMLPDILRAVRKEISDASLIIAGSGDDNLVIKKKFQEYNLEDAVTWTGRFSIEDIPSLVGMAGILIDPVDGSIANRAKSSFRVALGTAVGMAVVTSNIGIRTMLIPTSFQEKFFAIPGDSASYASKILDIMNNPISVENKKQLQEHAAQFSWNLLAKKYLTLIV